MSIDKIDITPHEMPAENVESGAPIHHDYQGNGRHNQTSRQHDSEEIRQGSRLQAQHESEEKVYRRLFEELQQEIRQKQERLEGANYRVGQLEALLKDTVPLLDYNRALAAEHSEKEHLRKNLDAQQFESEQILDALKEERFNKKVYLIILFILLLLQPLWFFFPVR